MKVTTKARYGINAIFELVLRQGSGPVPIKVIAEKQHIPEPYLEQLMNQLRRDGLVTSIRGAQGGYELSRPPHDITVGQVIRSLEGSVAPVDCLNGEGCRDGHGCAGRIIWEKIYDSINAVIDTITLADLAEEFDDKKRGCTP